VTPVVIDASAGVELVADTTRGRALRALLPSDAVPWAPDTFYVEVGTVLRRWDLNAILAPAPSERGHPPVGRLAHAGGPGALLVRGAGHDQLGPVRKGQVPHLVEVDALVGGLRQPQEGRLAAKSIFSVLHAEGGNAVR